MKFFNDPHLNSWMKEHNININIIPRVTGMPYFHFSVIIHEFFFYFQIFFEKGPKNICYMHVDANVGSHGWNQITLTMSMSKSCCWCQDHPKFPFLFPYLELIPWQPSNARANTYSLEIRFHNFRLLAKARD